MASVNVRGLDDEAFSALQTSAEHKGITAPELARRLLTAYGDIDRLVTEADTVMVRGGIPLWTRKKVLAVIAGERPSGVPHVRASA
jgi:hypothetical protein